MPKIIFTNVAGVKTDVMAAEGASIMEAAINHGISEIEAECGGAMACATCHVYINPAWTARIEPRSEFEGDMLEMSESEVRDESRLSCQIKMTSDLDGLEITLPG